MLKKSLPFVVGAAVIMGCVGLGANAAYGHGWHDEAADHTTVLWEYSGYPDLTKPQPYVDSVRGADIHAFDEYVKQAGMCGKTFQVDVYKTVVNGKNVSTLWSKGYLEYAHDGGFLAYDVMPKPYKVLTGKDTECNIPVQTPTPEPTTPLGTPTPTPTDTPTSPPTGEPTTPPVTESPEPTGEHTEPVTNPPTTPPVTETPVPTSTPSGPSQVPTATPSSGSPAPSTVPSTEPTTPQTTSPVTPTERPTVGSSPTPTGPTKAGSGTTPKTHSTDDTARTLAYTGTNAIGPLIAAGVLLALGGITLWIARRRKEQ